MKTIILLFILLISSFMAVSQDMGFRVLPEGGLSIPTGDFTAQNVFADKGVLGGINFDVLWGKFGVELFGGINNNGIDYQDGLPPTGGLIVSKPNSITRDSWKQLLVGLGPMYKIGLTKKLDLELSFKIGFSKFTYPEYTESIETGAPLNQRYLMYETRNQDIKDKLNLATIPAMKLSFKPSKSIAISLGASYTSAMGVEHSYTFLDGDFNPDMSDEQLETTLRTSPMVTNVYKCTFNSIGVTLGVGFTFGGKDKPKDDPKEDEKMDPPIPQYPEDGATITPEEADSLVLEWVKETPNVEKANYNLWLYEVRDSTRKNDSLIYKTKVEKALKLLLPDNIKLRPDSTYRYMVQAIDDPQLKPCPNGCNSVDATFTISNILQVQYYHLLTQNVGTYIEIMDQVKFVLPNNIETGGIVRASLINEANEEVIKIENLNTDQESEIYDTDDEGRIMLDIRRLESGYYVLEVSNERNKKYYLRIFNNKRNEPTKD